MKKVGMVFLLDVIAFSITVSSLIKDASAQGQNNAQVQSGDNAEQFALLCRIYNVAKNPPINHVDIQDPLKIVEEIDAINSSFAETKLLNETEQVGNSSGVQLSPTTTWETAIAQAILSHITQKAHTILQEIRRINVSKEIEKVKAELAQVIYGEGGNESHLCNGALKDARDRAVACGNSGLLNKGDSAGNNLVVDFFCLCAMRTDDNEAIKEVCGVLVGDKGDKADGHAWGTTCPSGSSSMWASTKKGCEKLIHQHPMSTEEGHEVIVDFLTHLKAGGLYRWGETNRIKGSDRKPGMLGTGVGTESDHGKSLVCDGSRGISGKPPKKSREKTVNPAGICVYYGSKSEWDNIPWVKNLRRALSMVESVNNQTATIQRDIDKLEMLFHRAEQIHETTKVISNIQNLVVPTNLQTAAKRLTAYNAARRHNPHTHFILMWVLL